MRGLAASNLVIIFFHHDALLFYFVDYDFKSQPEVDYSHVFIQEFFDSRLAVNVNALFSSLQGHRLEQPKQPDTVVCMHVADEDLHLSVHAKACLNEIALHPFTGVKE